MFYASRWAVAIVVVVHAGVTCSAQAGVHEVPGEFNTIQACIDAAFDGDECVVAPGTYPETIDFLGKVVIVRSSDGPAVTTIDGTNLSGSTVKSAGGEGPDTVLEGFTITGGTGSTCFSTALCGGGMFNENSSPTVKNCVFIGNTAGLHGGGMYNAGAGPIVMDCLFVDNTAGSFGGGMYNFRSEPNVVRCRFVRNKAIVTGGGMYNTFFSRPTVIRSTFHANSANSFGGGMFSVQSDPIVMSSTFTANSAGNGGGMYNRTANPTVTDTVFIGNRADFRGGAVYNLDGSGPTFTNCTFSGNRAESGAGMYSVTGTPEVTSSIWWGDSPDEIFNESAVTRISYSDIRGGVPIGGVDGGGTIAVDPMFARRPDDGGDGWGDDPLTPDIDESANDDFGDLRLTSGSPAVNGGDPAFVPPPGAVDLEGHARVLCGRVDMGAFESGIGDIDCDAVVTLMDFAAWEACMTGPATPPADTGCDVFDFDGDHDIDMLDFAGFSRAFSPVP